MREAAGLTQAEAAALIGVDTQSVSRWERGTRKVKAEDYTVALELYQRAARDRAVRTTQLGQSVPRGTGELREPKKAYGAASEDSWSPNPALANKIPKRAYDVAIGYCRRLAASGQPADFIDQIERLMIDPRYAKANKRAGRELSEEDWILLVDDIWDAVRETLGVKGVRV